MAKPTSAEIVERFQSHLKPGCSLLDHQMIEHYCGLGIALIAILPEGRKLSLALTELETSLLWALSALPK